MAIFRPRTVILLLGAIILLSIALRYPLVDHARGNDTYFVNTLVGSIQENDRAIWTFSGLSYFGYYPSSYPLGTPFILVLLADTTGMGLELAILIESMVFGVLFSIAVFCLSRQFMGSSGYSLLVAFLATVAPRFVDTSYWNASARTPFIALAMVLILVSFRASATKKASMYFLVFWLLVACFAIHHMAVLFLLVGLAYTLSTAIYYGGSSIARRGLLRGSVRSLSSVFLATSAVVIAVISIFWLGYFQKEVISGFQSTSLFSFEPSYLSALLNLGASYTNQIGFIFVLAILGAPFLIWRSRVSTERLFLVAIILVFIPMLSNALYVSMLLTPFAAMLGVASISRLRSSKRRKLAGYLLVAVVVASLALPVWSVDRWNNVKDNSGDSAEVDNQVFSDGAYLRDFRGDTVALCNVELLGRHLAGISGLVFPWSGVEMALSGDVTARTIEENLTWKNEDFPRNLYLWFDSASGPQVDYMVAVFFIEGMAFAEGPRDELPTGVGYYEIHTHVIAVVDNRWTSNYIWEWAVLPAALPHQLENARWNNSGVERSLPSYIVYRSEGISVYALQIPS